METEMRRNDAGATNGHGRSCEPPIDLHNDNGLVSLLTLIFKRSAVSLSTAHPNSGNSGNGFSSRALAAAVAAAESPLCEAEDQHPLDTAHEEQPPVRDGQRVA
jgi:hypothetical protein